MASPKSHRPRAKSSTVESLAKERWTAELSKRLPTKKATEPEIRKFMSRSSRDNAMFADGGSEARTLYFLLDDVHEVSFAIDRDGLLVRDPVIEDRQVWVKDRDGSLIGRPLPQEPQAKDEIKRLASLAKGRWKAELAERLPAEKAKNSDIHKHMARISRDNAVFYHGGTGSRTLYFLLDDVDQVRFDIDGDGLLVLDPVIEDRRIWIRDRDGSLLGPPLPSK